MATVRGYRTLMANVARIRAQHAAMPRKIRIGFFEDARYPDGTPVASVAAWNEFGTRRFGRVYVPSRPFFRTAIKERFPDTIKTVVRRQMGPDLVVTRRLASTLGGALAADVKRSITDMRTPPHSPATVIMRKRRHGKRRGSGSNPLIDTGFMRMSVTHKAVR